MLSLSSETAGRLFANRAPAPGRPLVIAVSGGGDSLFLLLAADRFLGDRGRRADLLAVTVDHGLRPESAAEASRVAAFCAERGIAHRTMRWKGAKPSAGVAAAAREARLDLLHAAARDAGAPAIAIGHTMDDQAETVFMRRLRGEGRGLAGIAPATLLEGDIWITRPLLSESRSEIRAALADGGIDWIEDPSNHRMDSERIRARHALSGTGGGRIRREVLAIAEREGHQRVAMGEAAAAILRRHAAMVAPGLYRLDPDFPRHFAPEAACLALRFSIANTGGSAQLPDGARTGALLARLAGAPFRATLCGAVIDSRVDAVFLHRERRARWTGRRPAVPGSLWDGRFRLGGQEAEGGTVVEALGPARAAQFADGFAQAPGVLLRAALAAEPALVRGGNGRVSVPSLVAGASAARRVPAPWARLLPSFDLAPARAMAGLMGGHVVGPPWTGHNDA